MRTELSVVLIRDFESAVNGYDSTAFLNGNCPDAAGYNGSPIAGARGVGVKSAEFCGYTGALLLAKESFCLLSYCFDTTGKIGAFGAKF